MALNLIDWMNLAVTQDPRDHDPGHPTIQKNSRLVFKSFESYRSLIQKSKEIGS